MTASASVSAKTTGGDNPQRTSVHSWFLRRIPALERRHSHVSAYSDPADLDVRKAGAARV